MSVPEDFFPVLVDYPYSWTKNESTSALSDFLTKYKPSMVQNDGTKPWIWVERCPNPREDKHKEEALEEGRKILEDATKEIQRIQNDSSIPTRSNKKTGARSKKELREEKQAETTAKLGEIAKKHGYLTGKWLITASADNVDTIWSTLANSLVNGPLSSTVAFSTKVSTSPATETPHYQHIICLYLPDVYDKTTVTEVMKVLLRKHGFNLTGVKSDFYTLLGIDSKHPSGLQSTIWRNSALMKDNEIKELKEAYFNELAAAKADSAPKATDDTSKPALTKAKPKLKKKQTDDPFASDDETQKSTKGKRPKESDGETDEEQPRKKKNMK